MKRFALVTIAVAALASASCGEEFTRGPGGDSRLQVYVHWGDTGIAQKRVAVVELGVEQLTGSSGIAEFLVPAGMYTIRAYDIDRPGPAIAYIDFRVTARHGATTRVDVVDCLPCVAPGAGIEGLPIPSGAPVNASRNP